MRCLLHFINKRRTCIQTWRLSPNHWRQHSIARSSWTLFSTKSKLLASDSPQKKTLNTPTSKKFASYPFPKKRLNVQCKAGLKPSAANIKVDTDLDLPPRKKRGYDSGQHQNIGFFCGSGTTGGDALSPGRARMNGQENWQSLPGFNFTIHFLFVQKKENVPWKF